MNKEALVVEDDASTADVLCRVLQGMDFNVKIAQTLQEARAQMAASPADLVLLDLSLPDGDGLEFMQEMGSIERSQFIVITGNRSQQAAVESLRADAADFLAKPVSLAQLRESIDNVNFSAFDAKNTAAHAPETTSAEQKIDEQSAVDALVGKTFWRIEKDLLMATLESTNGDKAEAARILGISLKTLYNRLNAYS